jgi:hemerythrin-like domain-containing protein
LQIIRNEHAVLAAVLRSLGMMITHGHGADPNRFFNVLRAMLFYIDEFPERRHHPNETELLFPRPVRLAPELKGSSNSSNRIITTASARSGNCSINCWRGN